MHAFTDGRDTSPTGGAGYLETVEGWCREAGNARVGSVVGRYFAMDRDKRWDRTQQAYDLIVARRGSAPRRLRRRRGEAGLRPRRDRRVHHADDWSATRRASATRTRSSASTSARTACARSCARWPTQTFNHPQRGLTPSSTGAAGRPSKGWRRWPPTRRTGPTRSRSRRSAPKATLASVLADRGVRQLHVAETEKYAHVTYFFNGGDEDPHRGEDRELVPSPRDVPTYDHKPEMSAQAARGRVRPPLAARTATASGSSTSPTRTWSATPA